MGKFYIGLDIGTDSCGIAGTDDNYDLLKYKGNDCWGVRLFDTAIDAKKRRGFRTARRRLARRRERILLLQELLSEEIAKKDNEFFIRLNNGAFFADDKTVSGKYNLFNDVGYTDKEFHKQYPTIYHLRSELLKDGNMDIRLIYLALHHMLKYRGHFLYEGQDFSAIRAVEPLFVSLNDKIGLVFADKDYSLSIRALDKYAEFAKNGRGSLREKNALCEQIFGITDKQQKYFLNAFWGGTVKLCNLFDNESYKDAEVKDICFRKADFDEKVPELQLILGDDFELIAALKAIYDWTVLTKILKDKAFISEAMVDVYNQHNKDLKLLKSLIKDCYPESYDAIFKAVDVENNYCRYVGMAKVKGKKEYLKKIPHKDSKLFFDFLVKILETKKDILGEDMRYKAIMTAIESEEFLPKIINMDNGVFPYQLNKMELKVMLQNVAKYYPCFEEKSDGITLSEKIMSLLEFKIPYYVGPLKNNGETKNNNAWLVRKEEGKILPWNFEEKVNIPETAEKFIRKMTNKCTYLHKEDVLPKNSILYSKFIVLNQLNKLKINGEAISVQLKKDIFSGLFKTERKVTDKKLSNFLIKEGYYKKGEELSFSGKDNDFTTNLSSYITIKAILGDLTDERPEVAEDIIKWHTLFTEKKMVERNIIEKYGDLPAVKDNVKRLKGLNFQKFGTMSQMFLNGIEGLNKDTGELNTIMDLLYNTNLCLQEILFSAVYNFQEVIDNFNACKEDKRITYADIDDMYLPPSVKRGVWQSMVMTEEYVKAIKKNPDKIFVEVTRNDEKDAKGKGKRKDSRLKTISDLYSCCAKTVNDIAYLMEQLKTKTEDDLRQDRLYLYFRQLGRCMYSGRHIDLGELSTDVYDIDHIYPQSIVKDDSQDNRVLVFREWNKKKSDNYPLDPVWQNNNYGFWKLLRELNLISENKYNRLMRSNRLTEEEMAEFVNRQLVFTNQSAKAVAELLHKRYPETEIVYSKAANVSDFRDKYSMLKNREVNDLHHAKDAYLNIVVGNVFNTKFGHDARNYFYKRRDDNHVFNIKKIYDYPILGAWRTEDNATLKKVKSVMAKNSCTVTRMPLIDDDGEFYNQTVYRGEEAIFPLKEKGPLSNKERYGGYKSLNTAYFMVVDSLDKKGKTVRTIEAIPVFYAKKLKLNPDLIMDVCKNYLGLREPKIIFPELKVKSLLSIDGCLVYLAGITGNSIIVHNAIQWFVPSNIADYLKLNAKFLEKNAKGILPCEEETREIVVASSRDGSRKQAVTKEQNLMVYDACIEQISKAIYAISPCKTFCKNIINGREKFSQLDLVKQGQTLVQIVKFLKCDAQSADLKTIGLGSNCGILRVNKDITSLIITQINLSTAGLHKNTIRLSEGKK